MSTNSQKQQKWIESYKSAYDQMDRAQAKLSTIAFLLSMVLKHTEIELDPSASEGLSCLLNEIASEMSESFYEKMPLPPVFADLCTGAKHE